MSTTEKGDQVSRYGAIAALFIAYALSGSVISSVGKNLATLSEQAELIMPLLSQVAIGAAETGMIFPGALVLAALMSGLLMILARSENHRSRFLTAMTTAWIILVAGVLFMLIGFTLPMSHLLQAM